MQECDSVKGVCVIYHDYHTRKDNRVIPHVKTTVRVVNNIKNYRSHTGLPFRFHQDSSHQWAERKIWSLWSGEITFQGQKITVEGWSHDTNPPLYWGATLIYPKYFVRADEISMWGWLSISDYPEYDRYINQDQTTASRKILKYLKGK